MYNDLFKIAMQEGLVTPIFIVKDSSGRSITVKDLSSAIGLLATLAGDNEFEIKKVEPFTWKVKIADDNYKISEVNLLSFGKNTDLGFSQLVTQILDGTGSSFHMDKGRAILVDSEGERAFFTLADLYFYLAEDYKP